MFTLIMYLLGVFSGLAIGGAIMCAVDAHAASHQ